MTSLQGDGSYCSWVDDDCYWVVGSTVQLGDWSSDLLLNKQYGSVIIAIMEPYKV